MRLDASQQMRLEQKMKLAPRMIQSMEILQLPLMALQERIAQELESNPLLEVREPAPDEQDSTETRDDQNDPAEGERDLVVAEDGGRAEDFQRLDSLEQDSDFGDYISPARRASVRRYAGQRDGKLDAMLNTASKPVCLNDYLHLQFSLLEIDQVTRRAGELIIDHIDDDGYLRVPLTQLGDDHLPWARPEQLERALSLVQTLEPAGVGARSLAECLMIQLEQASGDVQLEKQLVSQHLRDIEMNRLPAVAKKTGQSIERIKQAIQRIGKLNRRPGYLVGDRSVPRLVPDVIVEYGHDTQYRVRLGDEQLPSLRISRGYRRMLRTGGLDPRTRQFIQDNMRSARWLIESIEQRRSTLLRVVTAVLRHQRQFLEQGPKFLKPLPMLKVAQELGVHVGTISRAVAGKYIQTPRGIWALRHFFCGGTQTASGQSVSWDGIKLKLQEIIEQEDKTRPLSDDQIVERLRAEGLALARRTVAKYRKLLGILPARQRRQY